MRHGSQVRVPSAVSLSRSLNTVLETVWWPADLQPDQALRRTHDDCDGDLSQALCVYLARDTDVHLMVDGNAPALRFRAPFGGGMSPRVRNALLVLAEAIRRDNEEDPRRSGKPADDKKDSA